jgi:energy-coupling factor transport system substrate-specific component
MTTSTDRSDPGTDAAPGRHDATAPWRTVDVVVAAAIGVAFGVVFWGWNSLWNVLEPAFASYPPGRAFIYGMWLVPAVLGALVVRKRGAALFTEVVASVVSAVLGTSWGLTVVAYGAAEGAAAELVFALALYRSWRLPTALGAGAAAGAAAALLDLAFYYPDWSGSWQLVYGVLVVVSSAVLAGLGSWLLVRALARTGVLAPFGSGRDQARV